MVQVIFVDSEKYNGHGNMSRQLYWLSKHCTAMHMGFRWTSKSALAVFLALSAYHFGQDWEKKSILASNRWLSVISIPYMMWPEETLFLFQLITFDHPLHPLITTIWQWLWIGLCWCVYNSSNSGGNMQRVLMLYLIGYIVQPLTFFTLYFVAFIASDIIDWL